MTVTSTSGNRPARGQETAGELVADLMRLVNEAIEAARRDAVLRQSKLLPLALSKVAGVALGLAEDAELLRYLVVNDPRFGMPCSWMRHPTLREAVREAVAVERGTTQVPPAAAPH